MLRTSENVDLISIINLSLKTAMHELIPGLSTLKPPKMHLVNQQFDRTCVADVAGTVRTQLQQPQIANMLRPGMTVALALGSRGIANIAEIAKCVVENLKRRDIQSFIIPAMGSHGGATADGQSQVLAKLDITEQTMGVPIQSSMDAVQIGTVESPNGAELPVYMDAAAHGRADLIIPICRVKAHTSFKGPVESGICKMFTIGLGKQIGCSRLHREGFAVFDRLIPAAAQVVINAGKLGFALALVENAYEQTAVIEAVPADQAIDRDKQLLIHAKRVMARLLLPAVDVLVVEEIGKEISGVGMDSNVTGRGVTGFDGPRIERIVVLGLTEKTTGNAHGIGNADVITERAVSQVDRATTWTNTLTSGNLAIGKLPVALPTDDQAIMAAASCVPGVPATDAKIVRIKNTLSLGQIAVSESLLPIVRQTPGCEPLGPWDGQWNAET